MKIAICDDEQPVLNQLHKFINQYALDNLFDYTILEFSKSERLLEAASQDPDIKILFLDIYMSPLSGMDLAEQMAMTALLSSSLSVPSITPEATRSMPCIIW